jgi:Transposase IS116/IS110/IS902 family
VPRWSCTPTIPRWPLPTWPPRSQPRSACSGPPKPSWTTTVTPPSGSPATAGPAPLALARSLPGLAQIGGPALAATMGNAHRFPTAAKFRSFTGLAPRASKTGNTDRKPQPISKAGNRLLRTTLVRAADTARRQDPSSPACTTCRWSTAAKTTSARSRVVAAHLAERAWTVMDRGMPYVICDTDGTPVTPQQARQIIAQQWTVPEEVRHRRRSRKTKGKALSKSFKDMSVALKA